MNQAEGVTTLEDGTRHMDPFAAVDAWLAKYGYEDAEGDAFFAALAEYHAFCDGETMTGSLFAEGVTT